VLVEIWKLHPEGDRFSGEEPPAMLALEADEIRAQGPIRYDLLIRAVSGELLVNGSLAADIVFRCSRCAEPFVLPIREPAFECVRDYADKYQSVDLTPDIREAIILAFPNYPVCAVACRGLCPRCGANWNREKCGCQAPDGGPSWAALERLKLNNGRNHGSSKKEKIEE
jgi:uncharacterized protein